MRVLVCGGRDYRNKREVADALNVVGPTVIIQGGATGADAIAREYARAAEIAMQPNCGIDTGDYRKNWRGVGPLCEVVVCDFAEARARRTRETAAQADLFAMAAE